MNKHIVWLIAASIVFIGGGLLLTKDSPSPECDSTEVLQIFENKHKRHPNVVTKNPYEIANSVSASNYSSVKNIPLQSRVCGATIIANGKSVSLTYSVWEYRGKVFVNAIEIKDGFITESVEVEK